VRQRPGTAKGFVFLSVEDETGVFNSSSIRKTFDRFKFVVLTEPFLLIDGVLQNVDDVVSVKAARVAALPEGAPPKCIIPVAQFLNAPLLSNPERQPPVWVIDHRTTMAPHSENECLRSRSDLDLAEPPPAAA